MTFKYFYYISETKINLIQAQLYSGVGVSEIIPKIEFGGFGASIGLKPSQDDNVVKQIVNLLNQMTKRNLLIPLSSVGSSINAINEFYKDESEWRSGIISHRSVDGQNDRDLFTFFDAYVLWRIYGETLVLLLGSPSNIVGEHNSNEKIYRATTFMRIDAFLKTIGDITTNVEHAAPNSWNVEKYPNAATLAGFCLDNLDFPKIKIDLAFKVFQRLDFNTPKDLPFWFRHVKKLPEDEQKEFEKCRAVCVGSPLYTALL